MSESLRAILLDKIDEYKKRAGVVSDQVLSRQIFGNDAMFVRGLRSGGNFTVEKASRLERWLAHAEAMLSGDIPPGDLPPVRKQKPAVSAKPKAPKKPKLPAVIRKARAQAKKLEKPAAKKDKAYSNRGRRRIPT